jgi:hypothetical protein
MYTAQFTYNKQNGAEVSKTLTFDATCANHALRRAVKTALTYALHVNATVWTGECVPANALFRVNVNQVMGMHAGVTVNGAKYSPSNWVEFFPNN